MCCGCSCCGVADHLEHRAAACAHAVDREVGVEDLVPAVLAVGLREHHQLDVARVAPERREGVDAGSRSRRRTAPGRTAALACCQRGAAAAQHVDMLPSAGAGCSSNRCARGVALERPRSRSCGRAAARRQRRSSSPSSGLAPPSSAALQRQPVLGDALDAVHGEPAVVRDVGGLASPGRHGAQARRRRRPARRRRGAVERLAVAQQRREPVALGARPAARRSRPSARSARAIAVDACRCDRLQARQELLGAEVAESALPPSNSVMCRGTGAGAWLGAVGCVAAADWGPAWKPAILRAPDGIIPAMTITIKNAADIAGHAHRRPARLRGAGHAHAARQARHHHRASSTSSRTTTSSKCRAPSRRR